MSNRIYLSAPDVGADERALVADAFDSNWVAPLGPHVDAFEKELASTCGAAHAAALSSGTAAIHLALRLAGVGPGDTVLCSTLTFVASANPIRYLGAEPLFVDCERDTWTVSPLLVEEVLEGLKRDGRPAKALVAVDLYGQCADYAKLEAICREHSVVLIEDAAEALGSQAFGRPAGGFGDFGVLSFNGNKIITTSGGGALLSDDEAAVEKARFLASQARDAAPHYEHSETGYNYRLSNLLAALGRGQLRSLPEKVAARRRTFDRYVEGLSDLPGIEFMPEAPYCTSNRWLTALTIDDQDFGAGCEDIRLALEEHNIDSRPLWKPMHLQPLFGDCTVAGGDVAAKLFEVGLCLPSGSSLTDDQIDRVIEVVRGAARS